MTSLMWWLIAALVFVLVELVTVDLTFLMLAVGALVGGITTFALGPEWFYTPVIVFAVVSVLLIFLVRPWAKAYLQRSIPKYASNADGMVGKNGLVVETVAAHDGLVRIDGQDWTARSADGSQISPDETVYVARIDGATAYVSRTAPSETH
ncbi:hypothetical protein BSR29_04060 [Boudabousia liubingyangii]|uniref:NfeD-like C-terminal domain-containing protein n=1 Tax=Boudabousia liubingyangii TaxID=1921764 RepID=A0A1Q5PNB9_9ACTO|nr:NfeD family protein [Boudabousia liubingyangii]OKL47592.1 hypothetical protein BSR28_03630 [Boudabousia liubingyangii]OKL49016.1 hypothetical protein BSR29_04060 [Boudabousia liubingyangii]